MSRTRWICCRPLVSLVAIAGTMAVPSFPAIRAQSNTAPTSTSYGCESKAAQQPGVWRYGYYVTFVTNGPPPGNPYETGYLFDHKVSPPIVNRSWSTVVYGPRLQSADRIPDFYWVAIQGTLCGGVFWERQWHGTSAQAKLSISVTSIADNPGGVVAVSSSVNNQVSRWTISHPSQALFLPWGVVVHLSEAPSSACHCRFRWTISGHNGQFQRKVITKQKTSFRIVGTTRVAAEYVKVSGDISLVPARPDVELQPLAANQVRVSPFVALDAAKASWGLTDQQVDPHVGVVRALISFKDDPLHQNIKAWIVVGDIKTHCPAPGCNTVYSKMVIVVDADTGKALFSYPTDPSPSAPAMGPPPLATPPPGVYPPGSTPTAPTATPPATPTAAPSSWTGSVASRAAMSSSIWM